MNQGVHAAVAATVLRGVVALAGLLAAAALAAQPILIGQTAGHSGTASAGVKEATEGAKLYIGSVNAAGGVAGRPLELISMDDQFNPEVARDNARELINRGVIALFLTSGTPHAEAILPLLAEHKVPLVAPSTGAMVLHQPVNPWVFNVRATYQREAERAVEYLDSSGMTRVAVIRVDDSSGADALAGAMKGFAALDRTPVLEETFDRSRPDFSAIVPNVQRVNPQAVLLFGASTPVAQAITQLRAAGSGALMVTLSNNASAGFIQALGNHGRGVVVTQVFPYEGNRSVPIVKEAHELMRTRGVVALTPSMLEGFAAAKVLVEALRRTQGNLTREGVQRALNGLRKVDIGGLELSYSATDHTGLDYADLAVIAQDGRFKR